MTEPRSVGRPRYSGSLFKRPGSSLYWIQFYDQQGERQRESSGETSIKKAEKLLQKRLGQVQTDDYVTQTGLRCCEIIEDLLGLYRSGEIKGRKSIEWSSRRWNLHLAPFFSNVKVTAVRTDLLRKYVAHRQEQGAANGNINRELALLRRAYSVARQSSPPKVRNIPVFPRLQEPQARAGFLTDGEYDRLAACCAGRALWLRALLAVGYNFAWRKNEVLNLRVDQLDLLNRTIMLYPGSTKNTEGRTVVMTTETYELLKACTVGKKPGDRVFTHRNGSPVLDFRGAWAAACCDAGVGQLACLKCQQPVDARWHCSTCSRDLNRKELKYVGLIFHDLRRSGARNLRRLHISEGVIMRIGGWKTRSVFDRYDIKDQADLADAARRLDEKMERKKTENNQDGHRTATVGGFEGSEGKATNVQ